MRAAFSILGGIAAAALQFSEKRMMMMCMDVHEECMSAKADICIADGVANLPIQYATCEYDPAYVYMHDQIDQEIEHYQKLEEEYREKVIGHATNQNFAAQNTTAAVQGPDKYQDMCDANCAEASHDAKLLCNECAHKYDLVHRSSEFLEIKRQQKAMHYANYLNWFNQWNAIVMD